MKKRDIYRPEPRHDMMKAHHIEEHRHDPYKARGKHSDPCVCSKCMAVFLRGRWQWTKEPIEGTHWDICPACRRMSDKYPAGELTLRGSFLKSHGREIVRLARNTEALESREHPLQRIMEIKEESDRILITTTDIHLPRRIGHAIVDAYKGELDTHYDEDAYFVRMTWQRDL